MASEHRLKSHVPRKLTKRRDRSRHSMDVPDKFKDGDDAEDDVTAPKSRNARYMNQSIFSMVAAAGSKVDFNSRFDDDSSESEDEANQVSKAGPSEPLEGPADKPTLPQKPGRHRRKLSEHRLLKSLPKLNLRTVKEKNYMSRSSHPALADRKSSEDAGARATPREAPVLSRMLEAQAQWSSSGLGSSSQMLGEAPIREEEEEEEEEEIADSNTLAKRLMEIFEFDQPENVISEYPCWLLKSVLLQGYMYITTKHICFYAYLPKKSNVTAKSGYLSKRGRQNPKFNRYWFTLKGDVLSYYLDPSDVYFPSGNIDLRYGISATLSPTKEKPKEATHFTVTTNQRSYLFKADSPASAKEWVRTLQKVIFRSHNDGDSVKISLPIENVIDIEDSPVIDFAETFKIRVVDNDETYAIDEYFFSFFSFGSDALNVLRILVDDTPAQRIPSGITSPMQGGSGAASPRHRSPASDQQAVSPLEASTPILRESVRATLSPMSPAGSSRASPRPSIDVTRASFDNKRRSLDLSGAFRRPSTDRGSRSASASRSRQSRDKSRGRPGDKSPLGVPQGGSSGSFVQNLDQEPESTDEINMSDSTHASASQILNRSDVFQAPTIQSREAGRHSHDERPSRRGSEDPSHRLSGAEIRIRPPTRSQTEQLKSKAHPPRVNTDQSKIDHELNPSRSAPTLQELAKAGAYPLQRAAGFADYLKHRSKRMSSLLATESMGYIEKVSGMWTGARRHYDEPAELLPTDQLEDLEDEEDAVNHGDRFRAHFALPATEKLQATFYAHLHRVLPLYGKIYISNRHFCFRSLLPGTRTKVILPIKDIENVVKEKGFRFGYSGLVIVIRGHEELFFEFNQSEARDDCAITLLQDIESVRYLEESGLLSQEEKESADAAKVEHQLLQAARQEEHGEHEIKMPKPTNDPASPTDAPPILFDDPRASIINFKPTESLRITCLTIGSRGDVQPYIALCKGLLAEGHKPRIATHAEFEPWVRKHGIDFSPVEGDPAELMRICVENGMFTYSFIREASLKFRGWIDELLSSAWTACQDTDILIESPSAMAGIHIAEALNIPYFRAFTMPWTRTRAYPHAFAVPDHKMGGAYNYFSYVMFDNVFWKAIAGQVNRWRKKELNLRSTNLDKLQPNKVPFLYNFSPSVVVPPLDYSDWIRVTGYWFLDEAAGWTPPTDLTDFIKKARDDKKKIVYVGFGSIVVSDPAALTKTVIESVVKADVRCILSKGWSDRLGNKDASKPEVPLPKEIFQIKSAPHDWLFRQIDAAAHHGGAGTTGASLRAGLPTIIKPFFGDQFFFGSRVEDLGVGVCIKKLNVSVFSRALWESTQSERMIVKARVLGEEIRKENGVDNAIQALYRDLEYAKTLIKKRGTAAEEAREDSEESWTFIGDEGDPELIRRISEWDPRVGQGHAATVSGAPAAAASSSSVLGNKIPGGVSPGNLAP